jgi:hypothetical protein
MLPDIRVEQYEIKNQGTFDGAKWLTKYEVKIQFADRDIAYAMKDRIDKFLQGEDYRAMYLKVRDELAELQQRTWVGLTNDELTDLLYNQNLGQQSAVLQAIALLKQKNGYAEEKNT